MSEPKFEPTTGPARYFDLVFFLGFSFLLCHELDAIAQHEWRLLPILGSFIDEAAYPWFLLLHAPLFAVMLWATSSRSPVLRYRSQLGVDAFLVVHATVHFVLRSHELATFDSVTSLICIYCAGVVGLVHTALALANARRSGSWSTGPEPPPASR